MDAIFDFVGVTPTLSLAQQTVAQKGRITVVGIAGGTMQWSFFGMPYEAEVTSTYWGTIQDLHEVVGLYRAGLIKPDVEVFEMNRALDAYQKLVDGTLSARAVVAPHL